jgi:hypothetical protein
MDGMMPGERHMVIYGILCGLAALSGVMVWLYLAVNWEKAKALLVAALAANLANFVINLLRVLFIGFSDAFSRNTRMVFLLSVVLYMICFLIFRIRLLEQPDVQGARAVYYCCQFLAALGLAGLMSLLPALLIGLVMKLISWICGEN